jgi:hypothetical protein
MIRTRGNSWRPGSQAEANGTVPGQDSDKEPTRNTHNNADRDIKHVNIRIFYK